MKKIGGNGFLGLLAFIGLIVIAVLELFHFFTVHDIIVIEGGTVVNLLDTIKNICIVLVIGIMSFNFAKDVKSLKIAYIIALCVIVVTTVLLWVKF